MLNVYIPTLTAGLRVLPFIAPIPEGDSRLFQTLPFEVYAGIINPTDASNAEYMLIPHDYSDLLRVDRLSAYLEEARSLGKRPIVFTSRDNPDPIHITEAIIFRPSLYKSMRRPNEIVMPGYVEDLGSANGSQPLAKGSQATIGFAGKAGFTGMRERIRYVLRNYILRHGPTREGMYFRRAALASLARRPAVALDAIVRRRFSANRKTIEVAKEDARTSYIRSLKENLFTLAPRGDGNYSLRFYETLSMGRIPVLIDSDMILPLEDRLDYDSFVLRIPWQDVARTGELVETFFAERTEAELTEMQRRARNAFEKHLTVPQFLATTLNSDFLKTVPHASV